MGSLFNPDQNPIEGQIPAQMVTEGSTPSTQPDQDQDESDPAEQKPDELAMLKQRAKIMGISHSGNIGVETLRQKINDKMNGVAETSTKPGEGSSGEAEGEARLNPLVGDVLGEKPAVKKTLRQQIYDDNMKLVRCRITCLDPKKKDLPGEIFCIGNKYLGTVKKFVPFGEVTDEGYHVPYCIYMMMSERRFLNIRTKKDRRTGHITTETSWAKEFAIEVLPQLTPTELAQLATAQLAAGSIDNLIPA